MDRRKFIAAALGVSVAVLRQSPDGVWSAVSAPRTVFKTVGVDADGRICEVEPVKFEYRDGGRSAFVADANGQWYQIYGSCSVQYEVTENVNVWYSAGRASRD